MSRRRIPTSAPASGIKHSFKNGIRGRGVTPEIPCMAPSEFSLLMHGRRAPVGFDRLAGHARYECLESP